MTSGGRPRPELPRLSLERPARLRRIARWIDEQADRSIDPAEARELARRMRRRAAALELPGEPSDEAELEAAEAMTLLRESSD